MSLLDRVSVDLLDRRGSSHRSHFSPSSRPLSNATDCSIQADQPSLLQGLYRSVHVHFDHGDGSGSNRTPSQNRLEALDKSWSQATSVRYEEESSSNDLFFRMLLGFMCITSFM